ncbi:helix-turn-helix domain-containing protein [Devosia sp. SL43]|uniref:helix-turn-helix domain-containing protein n=1 Tax=Devosia sp. SL43 TaxID=2806348 RepID=UPI001F4885BA|nr:helix-turn-helix transcriptional regulator [Devosia sp. SL43]UJW87921.1 helix-turn-helix transcriptional regulator [Devosia sp. SL43]
MATKVRPIPKPTKPRHFIRQWRKYRRLTQEQLADRIDATSGAISQLENGIINYTQPTLEALAYALNCEPGDLLTRDPNLDGAIIDLMRLIRQKDAAATVMALLNALPDRTGTEG